MFKGWGVGDEMEWLNDTEHLILKPEWVEY